MTTTTLDEVVAARAPWSHVVPAGHVLRIVDLEGNPAVDCILSAAHDPVERYSAAETIVRQRNIFLTVGSELVSSEGNVMMTIVADTCGRHDTIGGACSRESNTMRYDFDREPMHACRDSFLCGVHEWGHGLGKRDITCNINFFMNVPVTPEGGLTFADGISAPGRHVEMRAERDVIALISNCPQLNNPCNAYNPTPVEVLIWD